MKVVADTMIWVSYCSLKTSYRYQLVEKARRKRVRFFVSDYILAELSETLIEDLGLTQRYAQLAGRAVLRVAKTVKLPPSIRSFVTADPKDNPIVQTALSAKADYLITADKEILQLGNVQDVHIITAQHFDDLLGP